MDKRVEYAVMIFGDDAPKYKWFSSDTPTSKDAFDLVTTHPDEVCIPFPNVGYVWTVQSSQSTIIVTLDKLSSGYSVFVSITCEKYDFGLILTGVFNTSDGEMIFDAPIKNCISTTAIIKSNEEDINLGRNTVLNALARLHDISSVGGIAYCATPNKANPKRETKGKKPLYDWHTVTIEPKKPAAEPKGGTHASPRPHDRRGTWCTSKLGKKYWRKNCVVNKNKEGFVFKDYVVKP